jgi:ankyrin repeat protein
LKTRNNDDVNIFTIIQSRIQLPPSQEDLKKCESLLDFFEEEVTVKGSIKNNSVWNEEPTFKAIRKNNLKLLCLFIVLGGKLREDDFKYLANKIEDESDIFAKKTYLMKFLSKIKDHFEQTLLHHAAQQGKLKCLKILNGIKLNVDQRKTDEEQTNCLLACKNRSKCAKAFRKNNVSVNVYDYKRRTPLHFAAFEGHQECLEFLIRKGGDVDAKDIDDQTPLHLATLNGSVDCMKLLLANEANVNARTKQLYTALHVLGFYLRGSKEDVKRCTEMFKIAGSDIAAKIKNDITHLDFAAYYVKIDCMEVLFANGADVNARDENDWTPLHWAASTGKVDYMEVLLANGADVKARDNELRTPLHFIGSSTQASRAEMERCLEMLINAGADVDAKEENDWTPLHFAANHGKVDCLEVLLANGADANARDNELRTPLHIIGISTEGSKEEMEICAEMLINAGADVDAKEENDWTPLHFAANHGKVDCLEVLLANGANVNARGNKQNTPLHIIGFSTEGSKEEKERCAEILINAGTDVTVRDVYGKTILGFPFFQKFKMEKPNLFQEI